MRIKVNGKPVECPEGSTLQAYLAAAHQGPGPFAVALNMEFVPRGEYSKILLKSGDDLEIVTPRQGG